jgi:hypothetical protein
MDHPLEFFLKKRKETRVISVEEHKRIVNGILGSLVEMNLLVAQWSKEVIETADKSQNADVIKFAKSSLLTLKKKMAEHLVKTTDKNDRV